MAAKPAHRRLPALVLALALAMAGVTVQSARAGSGADAEDRKAPEARDACGRQAMTGTFYQPLARHAQWPEQRWLDLEKVLAEFGMREIFVQWTVADGMAFFPTALHPPVAPSPLDRLFALAGRQGIGLWIGLELDKGFIPALQGSAAVLDSHLRARERRLAAVLPDLGAYLRRHANVAGWYISAETHDGAWLEEPAAAAVQGHLARVATMLRAERDMPIAISTFVNGETLPDRFARFWQETADAGGIDLLLFQDGVGAGKLSPAEAGHYAGALAAAMRGRNRDFGVIVEQFRPGEAGDATGQTAFVAAPLERIQRQLDAVAELDGIRRIAFSLPDFILPESGDPALLNAFRTAWRACR